jgi:hypothetical protein
VNKLNPWTDEEDQELVDAVKSLGEKECWKKVAKEVGNRTARTGLPGIQFMF